MCYDQYACTFKFAFTLAVLLRVFPMLLVSFWTGVRFYTQNGCGARAAWAKAARRRAFHGGRGSWDQSGRRAFGNRLHGMSGGGHVVVPPASLRRMRPCRLLRQLSLSACDQAFQSHRASRRAELRAGRGMVLGFREGRSGRRHAACCPIGPSAGPTGAGSGRPCDGRLGVASERLRKIGRRGPAWFLSASRVARFRSEGARTISGRRSGATMQTLARVSDDREQTDFRFMAGSCPLDLRSDALSAAQGAAGGHPIDERQKRLLDVDLESRPSSYDPIDPTITELMNPTISQHGCPVSTNSVAKGGR